MNMKRRPAIDGKVVVVTGASSGIGEATAHEFARAGAITVLAARRIGRLERLANQIHKMGGKALAVRTDLTDVSQITNLVQTTLATYGRIDVLANIAGWGLYDWFEELSHEELRRHYDVNVIGLAELTRQVIPTMKAQRSGFILNMSSYVSRIAVPPLTVYASTKYAIEGLTDALRRELLPWGITVIRIHPSSVSGTEFNQGVVRPGRVHYRSTPIGRVSRGHIARRFVELVEKPQRALFDSRIYEVPVFLNKLFPGFVDWVSETWVRGKRKKELPSPDETAPVVYSGSNALWPLLGTFLAVGLIARLWNKRSVKSRAVESRIY